MVLRKIWDSYSAYMKKVTLGNRNTDLKDLNYWQDQVFYRTISYALPLSVFFLCFYLFISYRQGHFAEAIISTLCLTCIAVVCLNGKISLIFKKTFIAGILTAMAILLIVVLGSFGIGSIYLLALSVFIALHFSRRIAYGAVVFNVLIYSSFALIINYRLFDLVIIDQYTTDVWIGYSLNFLFFDLVIVYEISYLLYGLKTTITEEQRLLKELKTEVDENMNHNILLRESEEHYKSLFFNNPTPMWVIDSQTLNFLQVNAAAIRSYGYSEAEFLSRSIFAIRVEEIDATLAAMLREIEQNVAFQQVTKHRRKNGEVFYAEINCSNIPFQGKKAILTIAADVSTRIDHVQKIERQNERFKEIAYLQSHVIRAPLARMKGLFNLISLTEDEVPDKEVMQHLHSSLNEMDEVIHTIVNHNEENSA